MKIKRRKIQLPIFKPLKRVMEIYREKKSEKFWREAATIPEEFVIKIKPTISQNRKLEETYDFLMKCL